MNMRPQQDHEPAPLSTGVSPELSGNTSPDLTATGSERANALRYVPGARGGHVESHFLKANSPDGTRALWIKHTVLRPTLRPEAAVAEVWAIAFRRESAGDPPRVIALKQSVPAAELTVRDLPFSVRTNFASLEHGSAQGRVADAAHVLAWDLTYACPNEAFRPFPLAGMYAAPLPRTKTLTPVPTTFAHGWFDIDGERWTVDGWSAAQGHNWGAGHAHAYAWIHGNAWQQEASKGAANVWIELLSARIKLGPLVLPWLSVGAVAIDDTTYRFDGIRSLLSRRVQVQPQSYSVRLQGREGTLEASFTAEPSRIAGLRYEDPDGSSLFCLNSKLAYGEVRLTAQGRTWSFKSDQVALEVGTRNGDHGLKIMI